MRLVNKAEFSGEITNISIKCLTKDFYKYYITIKGEAKYRQKVKGRDNSIYIMATLSLKYKSKSIVEGAMIKVKGFIDKPVGCDFRIMARSYKVVGNALKY